MNLSDLNALSHIQHVAPAAQTASFNATGMDLQQYEGVLKVTQNVGTPTGTTPTLSGKIQDSADNASFADVAGYTFAQATGAGSASIQVDTRAVRRYIRYVGTIGGTTPSFPMAVSVYGKTKSM